MKGGRDGLRIAATMHQLESFCAMASQNNAGTAEDKVVEDPLKLPVDEPMKFEPKKGVVELPVSLTPVDALATAAGVGGKGRVVSSEELQQSHAVIPDVPSDTGSVGSADDEKDVMGGEVLESAARDDGDRDAKPPANPAIAKTSLCSYFRKKGCNHGENCKFAHGESELQQRPDGSWDPTSERGKKKEDKTSAEDNSSEESRYRKCLVNIPMNWSQQKLKSFLDEKVSVHICTRQHEN